MGDNLSTQTQLEETVEQIGFTTTALKYVRWSGQRGSNDTLTAPLNLAVAFLLSLNTKGAAGLRAAVATQFTRALAAKAGVTLDEAPTENAALTEQVAAAAGPTAVGAVVPSSSPGSPPQSNCHNSSTTTTTNHVQIYSRDAADGGGAVEVQPFQPIAVANLESELASVVNSTVLSPEWKKRIIDSRLNVVASVNDALAGIADSKRRQEEHREQHDQKLNAIEADLKSFESDAKKRKLEMESKFQANAEARAKKQGKLDELEKSVALVRENGGLNARMTQMLARQVGLLANDGPVVQASEDLDDLVEAAAASDRRTAKVHLQVLAGGVVCSDLPLIRELRLAVNAAYAQAYGRRALDTEAACKVTERVGHARRHHVNSFPVARLETMAAVFTPFVARV